MLLWAHQGGLRTFKVNYKSSEDSSYETFIGYSIVRKSIENRLFKETAETLITEVSKTARLFNKLLHIKKEIIILIQGQFFRTK